MGQTEKEYGAAALEGTINMLKNIKPLKMVIGKLLHGKDLLEEMTANSNENNGISLSIPCKTI
jgi:hypothetical protein